MYLHNRWADTSKSVGRDGKEREFNHPFLQSCGMFLGEFTCLIAFQIVYRYYSAKVRRSNPIDLPTDGPAGVLAMEKSRQLELVEQQLPTAFKGNRNYNPLIFVLPAVCDLIATSTMYVGLNMTYASSFQMLRGALIIFTGLLSVAFLHRKLKNYEIMGIFFVIIGLIIVGLSDLNSNSGTSHGRNAMITGDLLIVTAQIITAVQMVVEERFVSGKNVSALEAVGWEGFFGFVIMSLLLIPFYFINVGNQIFKNPNGSLEDAIDGFYQISNNWQVATGFCGTILSISFFNFAGISVTKEISATTRTVLDSVRTFVVWLFGLAVQWQDPSWLQFLGFVVLMFGMFVFNDVLIRPAIIRYQQRRAAEDQRQIISEEGGGQQEIVS